MRGPAQAFRPPATAAALPPPTTKPSPTMESGSSSAPRSLIMTPNTINWLPTLTLGVRDGSTYHFLLTRLRPLPPLLQAWEQLDWQSLAEHSSMISLHRKETLLCTMKAPLSTHALAIVLQAELTTTTPILTAPALEPPLEPTTLTPASSLAT